MFSCRPSIVAWALKPPLTVLAAMVAAKVVALAGNAPATSDAVGATCTDWAVLADVYQVTTRCDSSAPTPRTMPVRRRRRLRARGRDRGDAEHRRDGQGRDARARHGPAATAP